MRRKVVFAIMFSFWLTIIIFLSLWPNSSGIIKQNISKFRWDYLEHFLSYFILGFFYIFWRIDQNLSIPVTEIILFIIAGLIFSWLTEFVQNFIPGRAFNINDMISNMVGILCGTLINYFVLLRLFLKNYLRRKATFNCF